jgi:hypothetical protein
MTSRVAQQTTLQTELHSKRRPPSPEQARAEQARLVDRDHAAAAPPPPLPAVAPRTDAPSTAVAVPSSRSAIDRILDDVAPEFLPLILFDGKEGHFVLHATNTVLDPDTRLIAHADGTRLDYVKFKGPGEQPERVGGPIYADGFKLPSRESLGDNDPAQWPTSDLTGKPEDPHRLQFMVPLENPDTGEVFAFSTMSATGRVAVGRFLRAYNRMRLSHPDALPIIQLRPSSYVHKRFGKVNIPALVIVGPTKGGPLTPLTPATIGEDMSDQIPF